MPSVRLQSNATVVRKYDIVGTDAENGELRDFIRHVALALEDLTLVMSGDTLKVAHMKPPHESDGRMRVRVHGTVPLTVGEQKQVGVFVAENDQEQKAALERLRILGDSDSVERMLCQYVICPHSDNVTSSDGTVVHRRFSCAGYVIEAYGEAELDLLDTRDEYLPSVCEDVIRSVYPCFEQMRNRADDRARLDSRGLAGGGPWRVVLPGYVLHALNRSEGDIREGAYVAAKGDEAFPRNA